VSRELRTVLILLVMGVVAVVALGALAGRLRTRIPRAEPGTTRQGVPPMPDVAGAQGGAERQVAAFVEVQRALLAGTSEASARAAVGLREEDYHRVRAAHRAWRDGAPVADAALARALEARRADLERLGR
jgi:hypothetical protein